VKGEEVVREKSSLKRVQAFLSDFERLESEKNRVEREIDNLDKIYLMPVDQKEIQNLFKAHRLLRSNLTMAVLERNGAYTTMMISLEKSNCKLEEILLIFEIYERHRMELDRVRSERERYTRPSATRKRRK
jgi:hypothetical protein